MYFFAIVKNGITKKPYIPCGDSKLVDVDGRYALETQYQIAADHLKPRFPEGLLGIACYRNISDKRPTSSVKISASGALDSSSYSSFDHGDTSIFY